jgi:HK97 family phage portal protein
MSFFEQLLEKRSEGRSTNPLTWAGLMALFNGTTSVTGKSINPSTALQLSAVYACVTLLSETFGSLPLLLYRRLEVGKERATNHPTYGVLHDIPNPEITSIELRSMMMAHDLLWGHSYAEVVRNGAGFVKQLWPIPPWRVTPQRNARNELVYQVDLTAGDEPGYKPDEGLVTLRADRILDIGAPLGLSPISLARETLGISMAAEEYGARFFSNNSTPGGILQHPGNLSKEAQDRLKEQVESSTRGLSNQHRLLLLEEGMQWHAMGLAPEDSQFLETRKFQTAEIARIFRVPPFMIGDVERSTSWGTGIEQQNIGFVTYSLRNWIVRWEQRMNMTLLSETDRDIHFIEILVDGLLRGDIKTRYESYNTGRNGGWLSANDIRELENMNPIDGGNTYMTPMNMTPMGNSNTEPAATNEGAS